MVHSPAGFKNLCQRTTSHTSLCCRDLSDTGSTGSLSAGFILKKKQELLSIIVPIKIDMLPRFQTPT